MKKLLLSLFLSLTLMLGNSYAQNYTVHKNLAYGTNKQQVMDIYEPSTSTPLPVVLLIHGGGFIGGSKDNVVQLAQYYAQNGYVVVNINYRLASSGVSQYPDAINDVA